MPIKKIATLSICLLLLFSLAGCMVAAIGYTMHQNKKIREHHEVTARNSQVSPDNRARVRFFGQAVIDIGFYPNKQCYGLGDQVKASSNGFDGILSNKENISLGMPITQNVKDMSERDGILPLSIAKAYYREYAVNGGEPLTIQASKFESSGKVSYSCGPLSVFFVPEKGNDYEVTLNISKEYCKLDVSIIKQVNSAVEVAPVLLEKAEKCSI